MRTFDDPGGRSPRVDFSRTAARGGALAAGAGGVAWLVKGVVTILTGVEPAYAYHVGLALFPLALLGLSALLPPSRASAVAVAAAAVGVASVAAGALAVAYGPAAWQDVREDTFTPVSATILGSALGMLVGLVAFGIASRRAGTFPGRWRSAPLAFAVAMPIVLATSALFEAIHPRLFETPMVLIGLGWMALAVLAGRAAAR